MNITAIAPELARLGTVLANPRSDPQKALVLYGIVLVSVLLALTCVGLLTVRWSEVSREREASRADGGTDDAGGGRLRALVLAAASVLIALAIVTVAFDIATRVPRVCAGCHGRTEHFRAWEDSTHADVACRRCHWRPGLAGSLQAQVDVAEMIANRLGGRTPPSALANRVPTPSAACRSCHREIGDEVVGRSVRTRHRDFVDAGHGCESCHERVGHTWAPELAAMTMNACLDCHDGNRADTQCDSCHEPGGFGPDPRVTAADYAKAGITKRDCEGCHSTKHCTACHGAYMPHPFEYAPGRGHALDAFTKRESCLKVCHSPADCLRCHSQFGTHGTDWVTRHGPSATFLCNESCHHQRFVKHFPGVEPSRDFCDNCHERPPLPRN